MTRRTRLRRYADILRVRRRGSRIETAHVVMLVAPGGSGVSRSVVSVARKFGSAVKRNRLRRQLTELLRIELPYLELSVDIVVFPRFSAVDASFMQLRGSIKEALRQMGSGARV